MADVSQSLTFEDRMSEPLNRITAALDRALNMMQSVQAIFANDIDTSSITNAENAINSVKDDLASLNSTKAIDVAVNNPTSAGVDINTNAISKAEQALNDLNQQNVNPKEVDINDQSVTKAQQDIDNLNKTNIDEKTVSVDQPSVDLPTANANTQVNVSTNASDAINAMNGVNQANINPKTVEITANDESAINDINELNRTNISEKQLHITDDASTAVNDINSINQAKVNNKQLNIADNSASVINDVNQINSANVSGKDVNISDNANEVIGDLNEINAKTMATVKIVADTSDLSKASKQLDFMNTKSQQTANGMTNIATQANRINTTIDNNSNSQNEFNESTEKGQNVMSGLVNKAKQLVSVYALIKTAKDMISQSDELAQTTSRINLMNDAFKSAGKSAMSTRDTINAIYGAAQKSRGSFSDMASIVARFGNNASSAFSSTGEVIKFAQAVQQDMTIAGATSDEATNAMIQLSQGLGSGTLHGQDLNSVLEQAPILVKQIADYMNQPMSKIRDLAQDGKITADVVKNAVLSASGDIQNDMNNMSLTWDQRWTMMKNNAVIALQPVYERLNQLANSKGFNSLLNAATNILVQIANLAVTVGNALASVASFVADHWNVIGPIIKYATVALTAYLAMLAAYKTATLVATAAQAVYNAVLAANPITLVMIAIAAVIALLYLVVDLINDVAGTSISATGIITGIISAAIAIIYNLIIFLYNFIVVDVFQNIVNGISWVVQNGATIVNNGATLIANIFKGIYATILSIFKYLATQILTGIDSIASGAEGAAQSLADMFVSAANVAIDAVNGVIGVINKLPGIDIDKASEVGNITIDYTSGIESALQKVNSIDTSANYGSYDSLKSFDDTKVGTLSRANYKSVSDAAKSGYQAGKGFETQLKNIGNPSSKTTVANNAYDKAMKMANGGNSNNDTNKNTKKTANNTDDIKKELDISNERLKYLRDIAERDIVNRFTTASINVQMNNKNNINNDMDINHFVKHVRTQIEKEMTKTAKKAY